MFCVCQILYLRQVRIQWSFISAIYKLQWNLRCNWKRGSVHYYDWVWLLQNIPRLIKMYSSACDSKFRMSENMFCVSYSEFFQNMEIFYRWCSSSLLWNMRLGRFMQIRRYWNWMGHFSSWPKLMVLVYCVKNVFGNTSFIIFLIVVFPCNYIIIQLLFQQNAPVFYY
jgi:hypothetical protein